jgi:class 3 adenylate cyclase
MVTHQTNRTFICSTVFVDLVEYSKKSVSEQLALKDRFTALLAEALEGIDINERIILDTGDGAAMSFLGDPEHALAVGMSLRQAFKDGGDAVAASAPIRIGINLGPVKLVKDINGHPNIVGDGINVAQRIMSFADSGQILVSRSYHDVVARLSEDYASLFKFEGSRTDKHVRDHEVYAVGESEKALERAKRGGSETSAAPAKDSADKAGSATVRMQAAASAFLHDKRKVAIAGGMLGVLILALATTLVVRKPSQAKPAEVAAAPAPADAPPAAATQAPKPTAPAAEPKQGADKAAAAAPSEPKSLAAVAKSVPAPQKADGATGTVTLAVQPWGEVFVNGHSRGVSPPLKSLKLPAGTYTIEVRNTTFAPGKQKLQVKPREDVTFRHVFK